MIILRQKNYSSIEEKMATAFSESSKILASLQPKGWKKTVLYARLNNEFYEICFYTKINNEFIKCYNLEEKIGITRKQLQKAFDEIYKLLLPIQKQTKCYVITISLDNQGHMTTDLEYKNHFYDKNIEKAVEKEEKYIKDWKNKYLK